MEGRKVVDDVNLLNTRKITAFVTNRVVIESEPQAINGTAKNCKYYLFSNNNCMP